MTPLLSISTQVADNIRTMSRRRIYREYGSFGNGGYRVRRSFYRWLAQPIYYWRLRQALRLSDMRRQPNVIAALHLALRERHPRYLDDWRATMREVGDAVDDLCEVMDWLREGQHYDEADRLRTILSRLAKSVPDHQIKYNANGKIYLIRDIARTFK